MDLDQELKEITGSLNEIIVHLKDHSVQKILLCGEPGCGKTWLARELRKGAMKAQLFRYSLWLHLAQENFSYTHLCHTIACQLGILPTPEEREEEEDFGNPSREGDEEDKAHWKRVAHEITEKLRLPQVGENLRCLFVLDNARDHACVKEVVEFVNKMVDEKHRSYIRFLITSENNTTSWPDTKVIAIKRFQLGDSLFSFVEKVRDQIFTSYGGSVQSDMGTGAVVEDCEFPSCDVKVNNCYWHFCRLFNKHGSIHYNELIAHWMIEGYLGPIHSINHAYRSGHDLFMKMVELRILECEESGRVALKGRVVGSESNRPDNRQGGFSGTSSIGLVNVFEDGELVHLEDIALVNGMMRTLQHGNDRGRCTSLLLDNRHLNRQVLDCFGETLKCLAYFIPRPISLPFMLSKSKNLSILILRDCRPEDGIFTSISQLHSLTILEISGNISEDPLTLPEDLFNKLLKLRSLNFSGLPIKALPKSFSVLRDLRWLILRECRKLSDLPSVKDMPRLEAIDLSGASSMTKLTGRLLKNPLQMVNLCCACISNTPKFDSSKMLTHLLLRGCSNLHFMTSPDDLASLQVLDISGAKMLRTITLGNKSKLLILDLSETALESLPSADFENMKSLCDLNLSRTVVENFDCLSTLHNLCNLTVQECLSLTKFPEIEKLKRLEVLNISGCKNIQDFPDLTAQTNLKVLDISRCESLKSQKEDGNFSRFSSLQSLNLSGTELSHAPVLSNLENLSMLSLSGLELNPDDALISLPKLEELYLKNVKFSQSPTGVFLEHSKQLRILELSSESLEALPSLSKLKNLIQLSLADCSSLETVPNLNELSLLDDLNLTNTRVKSEFFVEVPGSLKKLQLKDCASVVGSFPLKSLTQLELLDLCGTNVESFSNEVDQMTSIKSLRLSDKILIGAFHWNRREGSLEELVWDKDNLSKPVEVQIKGCNNKPFIIASVNHSFCIHEKDPVCWEAHFKKLEISFYSSSEGHKTIRLYGDEFIFKDTHSWEKRFPTAKLQDKSLEIHGYTEISEDIKSRIQEAANVAVVGSGFIHNLHDLGLQNANAMKVICVSQCGNMKCAFGGESGDVGSVKCPENLVLSNLARLESCFAYDMTPEHLKSLKSIWIDCCPVLQTVFSSFKEPISLVSIHIKFCEKLKSIFKEWNSGQLTLEKLDLFGLPDLEIVGANILSLKNLQICQCPKIETLDKFFSSAEMLKMLQVIQINSCDGLAALFASSSLSSSQPQFLSLHTLHLSSLLNLRTIEGRFHSLETLKIVGCPALETLDEVLESSYQSLTTLSLDSCPLLHHVFPSSEQPQKLEKLVIRFCYGLRQIFNPSGPSASGPPTLPALHSVHLSTLPELLSFECELPFLQSGKVEECPLLPSPQREKMTKPHGSR